MTHQEVIDFDQAYDHMDDAGQHNAAEIREALGVEPIDPAEFSVAAITARNPQLAEDTSNQKGGINKVEWAKALAEDPDAIRKKNAGVALVRANIKHLVER